MGTFNGAQKLMCMYNGNSIQNTEYKIKFLHLFFIQYHTHKRYCIVTLLMTLVARLKKNNN